MLHIFVSCSIAMEVCQLVTQSLNCSTVWQGCTLSAFYLLDSAYACLEGFTPLYLMGDLVEPEQVHL